MNRLKNSMRCLALILLLIGISTIEPVITSAAPPGRRASINESRPGGKVPYAAGYHSGASDLMDVFAILVLAILFPIAATKQWLDNRGTKSHAPSHSSAAVAPKMTAPEVEPTPYHGHQHRWVGLGSRGRDGVMLH